jgi:hypothetical protein
MAADPFIYCLEHLTDYNQFERLCHDLMTLEGYRYLEPLGGSKDKGRDAIHVDRQTNSQTTIFAYSVREDWRKKVEEDSRKIQGHGHPCQRLVFLCTATFTANERDEAVSFVLTTFGWPLDLYGLERLRLLLTTTRKGVVAHHPSIFCPPFFPAAAGLSLSPSADHLVIDHADEDSALAFWLARRLCLEGYHVWCRGLAPLAGSSVGETAEALMRARAFRYLSVISPAALEDPDLTARRALAHSLGDTGDLDLLLPVYAAAIDRLRLDRKTRRLEAAHFEESWAEGLKQILAALEAAGCPRTKAGADAVTLRSFMPANIVLPQPEQVISNCFPVLQVPKSVHRFISQAHVGMDEAKTFQFVWAFRQVQPDRFVSFHPPPGEVVEKYGFRPAGGVLLDYLGEIDGVPAGNLIPELVRKALLVRCRQKGLVFCEDRGLFYFPTGLVKGERLTFRGIGGEGSWVAPTGERTFRPGARKSTYRYALAPDFYVRDERGYGRSVLARIRLRFTDSTGKLLAKRVAVSRRKHLCKGWWNEEWRNRVLAVVQFLADEDRIVLGESADEQIVISGMPLALTSPVRLDDTAIKEARRLGEELLEYRAEEDEDDEDRE